MKESLLENGMTRWEFDNGEKWDFMSHPHNYSSYNVGTLQSAKLVFLDFSETPVAAKSAHHLEGVVTGRLKTVYGDKDYEQHMVTGCWKDITDEYQNKLLNE